jgi:hypothetical protein
MPTKLAITAVTALAALAAWCAPAGAAVTIGDTFEPTAPCPGSATLMQSVSVQDRYSAPFSGVITSWSVEGAAAGGPSVTFKVARRIDSDTFLTVGVGEPEEAQSGQLNAFPTRIPVQAGDVIGFYSAQTGQDCSREGVLSYTIAETPGDPGVGAEADYTAHGKTELDVSAQLEPDADGDGFGDETQDMCANVASTQGSCPIQPVVLVSDRSAPETKISRAPRKKIVTRRRKVRVSVFFASSEPGSIFTCRLDRRPASRCRSPFRARVPKGRHVFTVRATDAAGNVDPTPARAVFKVKRRSRRIP